MEGYKSLKQFTQDYKLYLAAKKVDPGREGETITSFFKNKIDSRLKNSSVGFKKMLKKSGYTKEDLKILATHEVMGEITELREFFRICFGSSYVSKHYSRLLSTNAFKQGKLKKIYEFIPLSIDSKDELISFIRENRHMTKKELTVIMGRICKKNWNGWMDDLVKDKKISFKRGCIYI